MTVVLDTGTVGVRRRAQLLADAMAFAVTGADVWNLCPAKLVRARINVLALGHTAEIVHHEGSAMWIHGGVRPGGAVSAERLSLGLPQNDGGVWVQHGRSAAMRPGELVLIDFTAPYDLRFADGGRAALQIDLADVSLTVDQVRAALGRLACSPVYSLARAHLREMARDVSAVASPVEPGVAEAVRRATAAVIQALIITSTESPNDSYRQALQNVLLPRLIHHVRGRLGDRHLDAPSIAAAHGLTLGELRRAWSPMQMDLEDWITVERLAAAREAMLNSLSAKTPITFTASLFGFRSTGEFGRAYRRAFGRAPDL